MNRVVRWPCPLQDAQDKTQTSPTVNDGIGSCISIEQVHPVAASFSLSHVVVFPRKEAKRTSFGWVQLASICVSKTPC